MRIILLFLSFIIINVMVQTSLYAKTPTNRVLASSLNELTKQVATLNSELEKIQASNRQLSDHNKITKTLLEQELVVLKNKQSQLEEAYNYEISALKKNQSNGINNINKIVLGLLAASLMLWIGYLTYHVLMNKKRYLDQMNALSSRLTITELSNKQLHSTSEQVSQDLVSIQKQQEQDRKQWESDIAGLHKQLEAVVADKEKTRQLLANIISKPLSYMDQKNIPILKELTVSTHLSFVETLKAKAVLARYEQNWKKSKGYWQTVLLDEDALKLTKAGEFDLEANFNRHEALLNIAYMGYKLAETDSKQSNELNHSLKRIETIMMEASDYFDDAYGYDNEFLVPEDVSTNESMLKLYQQTAQLMNQVEELKNYHAVYNLACDYIKEGKLDDAQECLEQVTRVYNVPNFSQLKEDDELESIRETAWFKKILDNVKTTQSL